MVFHLSMFCFEGTHTTGWGLAHNMSAANFYKSVLTGTQSCSSTLLLSIAAFIAKLHRWTGTKHPTKLKIFTNLACRKSLMMPTLNSAFKTKFAVLIPPETPG
jgi:hypothetical protein